MGPVPFAVVLPVGQGLRPLLRVLVCPDVGPLAQGLLDEAFDLAAGLQPVGSGELVSDAQRLAGSGESARAKRSAVVGEQPLNAHTQSGAALTCHRISQESQGLW